MRKVMKLIKLLLFVLVINYGITGCDEKKTTEKSALRQVNYITVSSIPLIQQVLESNTPLFQGKTNANIMRLVCQYVSGDITRETFDEYFISRHVDIKQLAEKDAGFRFLADRDKGNYAKGCASYITSKFFSYEMLILDEKISDADILATRLKQLTPTALKVSQYIAEIAATQDKQYDSIAAYKKDVESYILVSAKRFITDVTHEKYDPALYEAGGKESGITYEIRGDSLKIYIYGELWLGQGKAMGSEYKVSIKNNTPHS